MCPGWISDLHHSPPPPGCSISVDGNSILPPAQASSPGVNPDTFFLILHIQLILLMKYSQNFILLMKYSQNPTLSHLLHWLHPGPRHHHPLFKFLPIPLLVKFKVLAMSCEALDESPLLSYLLPVWPCLRLLPWLARSAPASPGYSLFLKDARHTFALDSLP